jgi:hypothetical protein
VPERRPFAAPERDRAGDGERQRDRRAMGQFFAGARASLAFGSLRGRFAALLAGARASLAFGSLRGRVR